jgi:hypothetical protein
LQQAANKVGHCIRFTESAGTKTGLENTPKSLFQVNFLLCFIGVKNMNTQ